MEITVKELKIKIPETAQFRTTDDIQEWLCWELSIINSADHSNPLLDITLYDCETSIKGFEIKP